MHFLLHCSSILIDDKNERQRILVNGGIYIMKFEMNIKYSEVMIAEVGKF